MIVCAKKYPALASLMVSSDDDATYEIVRHYKDGHDSEIMETGLTRQEAQEWCKDPETSSKTAEDPENVRRTEEHGEWFDGFREE